jgi:radical SAM protein with 4Fe4S-binding SPASM domain
MININKKQKILLARRYKKTALNTLVDSSIYIARRKPTPYPRLINLFITENCNFACPMCHVKESRSYYKEKKTKELSMKDLLPLIKEAGKYGSAFQIVGGEPLLHRDIVEIVKTISQNKIPKGITTNGLLLEKYAQALVEAGLDFLAVSLDGCNEEYQYKRGFVPGSFDAAIRGIKKVVEARGSKSLPNVRVATVVAPMNINNFEKVLDVAREAGADQWSISHYFYYYDKIKKAQEDFGRKYDMGSEVWGDFTGGKKEFYNDSEIAKIEQKYNDLFRKIDAKETANIIVSLQRDVDIKKYYKGCSPLSGSVCSSPYQQVFIRGNGDVEMCQGYILGNIKKESLKNIWTNERARHFRKIFAENKTPMPACFRCCALDIKF